MEVVYLKYGVCVLKIKRFRLIWFLNIGNFVRIELKKFFIDKELSGVVKDSSFGMFGLFVEYEVVVGNVIICIIICRRKVMVNIVSVYLVVIWIFYEV